MGDDGAHGNAVAPADAELARRVKGELRKRLRGVRNLLAEDAWRAKSAAICEALTSHEAISHAKSVALFWPMTRRREVDLRVVDGVLRGRGVRIAYPLLVESQQSVEGITVPVREMQFRWVDDPAALCDHGTGIDEPPFEAPRADALDAIVVPALAADVRGHRLGYGAGFYDRTLPTVAPPARTVVVVFDFQLVAELPALGADVACEFVVTDRRALTATR